LEDENEQYSDCQRVKGSGWRRWFGKSDACKEVEAVECPKCGLVNPDNALRCDCGYDFATGQIEESYLEEAGQSTDIARANKRIKQAWIVGVIGGVITLIATLLSVAGVDILDVNIYVLIDVVLVFGLAYGIYRKSRVCAVIMFVYFVGTKILMLVESGRPSGLVMAALFGYWFFQGIRGTFAYHKLEPTAKKLKAKTLLLVFGWVLSIIVVFFLIAYFNDEDIKRENLEYGYYEHGNRVVSEKPVAQIDTSSWIEESLRVSPDSQRVACVAKEGRKRSVVVDGRAGEKYDDIGGDSLIFSPDSQRVAYSAQAGDKWFVVVDGKEGKEYDYIGAGFPLFSPDSRRVAYSAQADDKWLVVVDGKEGKIYDGIAVGGRISPLQPGQPAGGLWNRTGW
jgi:hypothetical protein